MLLIAAEKEKRDEWGIPEKSGKSHETRVFPKLSYVYQGKTSEFGRKMGFVNLFVLDALL